MTRKAATPVRKAVHIAFNDVFVEFRDAMYTPKHFFSLFTEVK